MAQIDDILSKVDDTSFGEYHHKQATPYACYDHYLIDCLQYFFIVEDDWNVVFDECSPLASKCQQLSAYLGLKLSIIDRIKSDFPSDSLGCWSEALKEWIKMNYDIQRYSKPSWKTLLKAIAKVDNSRCRRLATKHQGMDRTDSTSYIYIQV